ncbi:phosphate/phosphite/phosphonate ABC transporter substrate-binding protein [Natrialba swarupiae]|uniref:phosphate/phosphite/phosphonate ABC transporter substrate-binding protein n=1 Tax=Natrialba swarupiae TaxID=2448032 RepID=UPI001EE40871|nr:phosphate/phosphite/phosphonate ABC transporter substrate-binding protein [Natrialba swarupiae]
MTGAATAVALAGCTESDTDSSDDSSGGSSQAGAGLGGGEGGEIDDPMISDEFDPANPDWENNNYLGDTLMDAGFDSGQVADLEAMLERDIDEPAHGNPVTETPDDPGEWLDPDVLTVVDNPSDDLLPQYDDAMDPLVERIEEETGKEVDFLTVDSYAATVEAMRAREAPVGRIPTGSVPFAVNLADFVPVATTLSEGGQFGYRLWATTRADNNDVQSVGDFADVSVAHTDPGSNSGHQAPSALFQEEFGVIPGEDYEIEFSGGHDQSVRGIGFGDYDAGPVSSGAGTNAIENTDDLDFSDFKIVWASDAYVSNPFGWVAELHPDIQDGLRRAWLETDWSGTATANIRGWADLYEVEYKYHFHPVLVAQRLNEVDYESGEL